MTINELLKPVAQDMQRVDEIIREHLSSEVALINQISAHIVGAGGKRMRPSLLLLVARALGAKGDEACRMAAIIEFIHTATLLHDDVVDETSRRRGRDTANALWGNAGAVLAGDFLYSRSFQMMVGLDRMAVMQVLADATNAIAEGEVLQLMNCGDPDVTEARYLQVIELKTARLFQAAGQLGASAAGCGEKDQQAMAEFGRCFGLAFQIVDDMLDYTADPEHSGKNLGTDLAEGKPTLPLIHAMTHGSEAEAGLIRAAISEGRIEALEPVQKAIESTGSLAYTAALAARFAEQAQGILGSLNDSEFSKSLRDLTAASIQRAH